MLEVHEITKYYSSTLALESVSFRIQKGQVVGFLGPNGAGKSTSMKIISGFMAPSSGQVKIDGIDLSENPVKAKQKIGYLPEVAPLYLDMRVGEYLSYVCHLKNVSPLNIQEFVRLALEQTSLLDVKNKLIANLSKGYKQRVGIAQAVVHQPELVILDEPSVGLDPKQVIEIRDLIKGLAKDKTVLVSSHILSEIQNVCDHILVIHKGKLLENTSTENLLKRMSKNTGYYIYYENEKLSHEQMSSDQQLRIHLESDQKRLYVETKENLSSINELLQELMKRNILIKEVRRVDMGLEEAYLKITADQNA